MEQIPLVKVGHAIPPMSIEQRADYDKRAKEKHMAQKKISRKTQPSQNYTTMNQEQKDKVKARKKRWEGSHPEYKLIKKATRHKYYLAHNAEYQRKYGLRNSLKQYNLTEETYQAMLSSQAGVCAVCHGVNKNGKRLFVDHNHSTGKIRGLLCHNCNSAIGHLRDNPSLIRAAAEYLERSEGQS